VISGLLLLERVEYLVQRGQVCRCGDPTAGACRATRHLLWPLPRSAPGAALLASPARVRSQDMMESSGPMLCKAMVVILCVILGPGAGACGDPYAEARPTRHFLWPLPGSAPGAALFSATVCSFPAYDRGKQSNDVPGYGSDTVCNPRPWCRCLR
jgi:hypothetical protein